MIIIISTIDNNTAESDLNNLFAQFGVIKAIRVATDFITNRSQGFGVIIMADNTAATRAIQKLDGTSFRQQVIRVSAASLQVKGY